MSSKIISWPLVLISVSLSFVPIDRDEICAQPGIHPCMAQGCARLSFPTWDAPSLNSWLQFRQIHPQCNAVGRNRGVSPPMWVKNSQDMSRQSTIHIRLRKTRWTSGSLLSWSSCHCWCLLCPGLDKGLASGFRYSKCVSCSSNCKVNPNGWPRYQDGFGCLDLRQKQSEQPVKGWTKQELYDLSILDLRMSPGGGHTKS